MSADGVITEVSPAMEANYGLQKDMKLLGIDGISWNTAKGSGSSDSLRDVVQQMLRKQGVVLPDDVIVIPIFINIS